MPTPQEIKKRYEEILAERQAASTVTNTQKPKATPEQIRARYEEIVAERTQKRVIPKRKDFSGRAKDRFEGAAERITPKIVKAAGSLEQGKAGKVKTAYRLAGNLLSGGAEVVFGTLADAAVPDQISEPIKKKAKELIETPVGRKGLEMIKEYADGVSDRYEQYKVENPEKSQDLEALLGFIELYPGAKVTGEVAGAAQQATKQTLRKVGSGIESVKGPTIEAAKKSTEAVKAFPQSTPVQGLVQKSTDLAERIPRAAERAVESTRESAERAARIKAATPEVAQAIKSNLDDRVIQAVNTADEATRTAQKQMIELADSTKKTLGIAKRPEYVAGEAAASQYKILEKQRRAVGKEIEEATRAMSKTGSLDITEEIAKMQEVLSGEGIQFKKTGIDFRGSNLTRSQRTAVKELYELATEAGDTLTPFQVYKKDQLFSQLSREARFEKIGNVFVSTPEGPRSIYSVFRDIFNTKLDTVSDEIREINGRYGEIKRLTDDIEKTIAKTGKLDATKNIDLAEVAQTRLRRLSSDAQSAAEYREIVKQMDAAARKYGYEGANPAALSDFAIALRDIYPTAVPKTSATAILGRPSLVSLLEKAMSAGAPDVRDQQKALKALLGIHE